MKGYLLYNITIKKGKIMNKKIAEITEKVYLSSIGDDAIYQMEKAKQIDFNEAGVFFCENNPIYVGVLNGIKDGQIKLIKEAKHLATLIEEESLTSQENKLILLLKDTNLEGATEKELQKIKLLGYSIAQGEEEDIA